MYIVLSPKKVFIHVSRINVARLTGSSIALASTVYN